MKDEHHASKFKGLAWIAAGCLLGAAFALGIAPLAHIIPWQWEERMAAILDDGMTARECHLDPQADALLARLKGRLYPVMEGDGAFSIRLHLVRDPAVNAYAGLGGEIVIHSGFLAQAQSPEELAGVLAHEIEHVRHRHIMEGALTRLLTSQGLSLIFSGDVSSSSAQWAEYFLTMSFTRTQEEQADEEGLKRLGQAHIDNKGFVRFFERMEKEGEVPPFLSDHPPSRSRAEMAKSYPNIGTIPVLNPPEWEQLKQACK